MSTEDINNFDESKLTELSQTIKDINPDLFKKIVENNKECYFDKKLNSLIDNYQLDKIDSANNMHINDLLNINNISNLKIYCKPILLIYKIYNMVCDIDGTYNYNHYFYDYLFYNMEKDKIKLILCDFNFENITTAIDILYNLLINHKYPCDYYIEILYISYFLLIKTIGVLNVTNKHIDIDELLCNGYNFNNNNLKPVNPPIKILNTISVKPLLELCILLIINRDCENIENIENLNLNLNLVCDQYINNEMKDETSGCIEFNSLPDILYKLSLIANMYHCINNQLIIPAIFSIVKNTFVKIRRSYYNNNNICNNCIYSFLLNYFTNQHKFNLTNLNIFYEDNSKKIVLDIILYHDRCSNTKKYNKYIIHNTSYNYINEIANTTIYKRKTKNLIRKKIKYGKKKLYCNVYNIKTIYDLLDFMVNTGINIQYCNSINDILLKYIPNDFDYNIDLSDENNIKIVTEKILNSETFNMMIKYIEIYCHYYLDLYKLNFDFLYYETILLFKCAIIQNDKFIPIITCNLLLLLKYEYVDISLFLCKIFNSMDEYNFKNISSKLFINILHLKIGTNRNLKKNKESLIIQLFKMINLNYKRYAHLINILFQIYIDPLHNYGDILTACSLLKFTIHDNKYYNKYSYSIEVIMRNFNEFCNYKEIVMNLILVLTSKEWNLNNKSDIDFLSNISICIKDDINIYNKMILYSKDDYKIILSAIKILIINSNILNTTLSDHLKTKMEDILNIVLV